MYGPFRADRIPGGADGKIEAVTQQVAELVQPAGDAGGKGAGHAYRPEFHGGSMRELALLADTAGPR